MPATIWNQIIPVAFGICLFLLSGNLQASGTDFAEQQITEYFQNIERGEYISESLWGIIMYARQNEPLKKLVIDKGRVNNYDWIDYLNQEELNEGILQISIEFQNEHLLTFLLLQTGTTEKRIEFVNQFYTSTSSSYLKDLNAHISNGHSISMDLLSNHGWDFSLFLITFYNSNIDFENDNTFTVLAEFLDSKYNELIKDSNNEKSVTKDFLKASVIQSLYQARKFDKIVSVYDTYFEFSSIPNTSLKRNLFWGVDFSYYRTGFIDRSIEIQRRFTIPISEFLNDRNILNSILANHGGYLLRIGRFQAAKEVVQTALDDSLTLNSTIKTRLLHNLSLSYYRLGEIDKYIVSQLRALDFASEEKNYNHQLNIYRNLHIYNRKNRNWELALEYINAAREVAEKLNNKSELASIIIQQAIFHRTYFNDIEVAEKHLETVENLFSEETNHRLLVLYLYEKAEIFKHKGQLSKSRDIYERVTDLALESSNNSSYLEALVDLAKTEFELTNFSSAKKYIREFNIHDISVVEFYVLVKARQLEAQLAIHEGRYKDAESALKHTAEQVLERARESVDPEAGYWHIEDAYLDLFNTYTDFLSAKGRNHELVGLLDQLKTINDAALFNNPLIKSEELSEEELTEEQRLTEDINRLRKQLLIAKDNRRLEIQNEISTLTARKNQLTNRAGQLDLNKELRLWTIQSKLKPSQMILHITQIQERLFLIRINSNNIMVDHLPLGESEEELFESAIDNLVSGQTNLDQLYEIYRYLNLDQIPRNITNLIVIPDSYLYQLPLDVLPVESPSSPIGYGSAKYLVEEIEISYLNNIREYLKTSPKPLYALDFTGFGISEFQYNTDQNLVPLPKAPFEVENVDSRLGNLESRRIFINSEATPAAFRSNASNSRILHMATHSTISENDPLFSRLYLHPGNGTSSDEHANQIFAYELFNMNLQNDLIMLNSCESGSGRYFQGAGIMGISRALRYAGARSLILNSWSVNDQFASDFAIEFYENINRGKSKSKSLRAAKLHFLKNKNANPHYWGPYMLNGEPGSITRPGSSFPAHAVLASILIAGILLTRKKIQDLS